MNDHPSDFEPKPGNEQNPEQAQKQVPSPENNFLGREPDAGPLSAEQDCDALAFCSGQVDPLIWLKLVSNELDDDALQSLLERMQGDPELWRDCALAFLEEQALRRCFAEIGVAGDRGLLPENEFDMPVSESEPAHRSASEPVPQPAWGSPQQDRFSSGGWMFIASPMLAIAAGLLLTWSMQPGWQPQWFPPFTDGSSSADSSENSRTFGAGIAASGASVASRTESGNTIAGPNGDVTDAGVEDLQNRWLQYHWNDARFQQWLSTGSTRSAISPHVETTPVGYRDGNMQTKRMFLFLTDPNGRRIVLPVDQYSVSPAEFQ